MLIIIEEQNIDTSNIDHRSALENLLLSHHDGRNILFTKSRKLLKSISSDERISERARNTARAIRSNLTFEKALTNGPLSYISTSGIGEENPKKTDFGWHVKISYFNDATTCERPTVIGESNYDIKLFENSAKHFLVKNRLNNTMKLKFTSKPGGGNSTCEVLRETITEGKFPILCIVDSDKKSPNDNIKETARRARQIDLKRETNIVYVLPVRAAENTIPKSILKQKFQEHSTFINKNFEENRTIPFGYANLKKENTLKEIYSKLDNDCQKLWIEWAKKGTSVSVKKTCLEGESCPDEICQCILTPSFSEGCLEKINNYFTENATHSSADKASCSIGNVWEEIGKLFASYTICSKPVRVG